MIKELKVANFGPISSGAIEFGDLTIFVGPQASGKSLLLQLYKYLEDSDAIYTIFKNNNYDWRIPVTSKEDKNTAFKRFLDLYFGNGMHILCDNKFEISTDGTTLDLLTQVLTPSDKTTHSVFYIPAQRTLAFQEGWPKQFSTYSFGTPFSLRYFSDTLWNLLDSNLIGTPNRIFPVDNRLKKQFRENIDQSIYWGYSINIKKEARTGARGIELFQEGANTGQAGLTYNSWSSGQREFTPLLLGCYYLLPAQTIPKKEDIDTIIIEEPEMGLHPQAIISFFQLVVELLWRGYRVILSTHSNIILDIVWALVESQQVYRNKTKSEKEVYTTFTKALNLKKSKPIKDIFDSVIQKQYKTYSFNHITSGVQIRDISSLNPASEDYIISGWGGIAGCTEKITDAVGELFN